MVPVTKQHAKIPAVRSVAGKGDNLGLAAARTGLGKKRLDAIAGIDTFKLHAIGTHIASKTRRTQPRGVKPRSYTGEIGPIATPSISVSPGDASSAHLSVAPTHEAPRACARRPRRCTGAAPSPLPLPHRPTESIVRCVRSRRFAIVTGARLRRSPVQTEAAMCAGNQPACRYRRIPSGHVNARTEPMLCGNERWIQLQHRFGGHSRRDRCKCPRFDCLHTNEVIRRLRRSALRKAGDDPV